MKKMLIIAALLINTHTFKSLQINHVAVFCSADDKVCKDFKENAFLIGKLLGEHGFSLVTGGSRTGLMKEVIDGYITTSYSKNVYGVLPMVLKNYDIQHKDIPENQLLWVKDIHTRLSTFHKLSDAVIVLPGGYGTLHELLDFLVHCQFGLSKKKLFYSIPIITGIISYNNFV